MTMTCERTSANPVPREPIQACRGDALDLESNVGAIEKIISEGKGRENVYALYSFSGLKTSLSGDAGTAKALNDLYAPLGTFKMREFAGDVLKEVKRSVEAYRKFSEGPHSRRSSRPELEEYLTPQQVRALLFSYELTPEQIKSPGIFHRKEELPSVRKDRVDAERHLSMMFKKAHISRYSS